MHDFDFQNAQLPALLPLVESFEQNSVESDLKALFLKVFADTLAKPIFDENVLGMAHVGSLDLIRQSVSADGFVLLDGDIVPDAMRYLYRAWKSRNVQGRGMHFVREFLQLLFPNIGEVTQLWHGVESTANYPHDVREGEEANTFLTSRIRILVEGVPSLERDKRIMACISASLPARLIPTLRYKTVGHVRKIRLGGTFRSLQYLNCAGELKHTFQLKSLKNHLVGSTLNISHGLTTQGNLQT